MPAASEGLVRAYPPIVLIIDDNADHIAILSALLSYHGYALMTANTPENGLRFAAQHQPSAILLDLHFDEDPIGIRLIDQLHADPATSNIPLLVVSSFTDFHDDELRARGVPHVSKGGDIESVLDFVRGVADPERMLASTRDRNRKAAG